MMICQLTLIIISYTQGQQAMTPASDGKMKSGPVLQANLHTDGTDSDRHTNGG